MKKNNKKIIILLSLLFSLLLTACGGGTYESAASMDSITSNGFYEGGSDLNYNYGLKTESMKEVALEEEMYDESVAEEFNDNSNNENNISDNRKLIRNVNLDVETLEYDIFIKDLESEISKIGGYIQEMRTNNGSIYYRDYEVERDSYYVLRIPSDKLNSFLNKIGDISNITSKSERVEDVTLQYVDMDSHVKMLKEEQDRLLTFLGEAETIEEIITIEGRLSEVKYQIESMNSQLRTIDNQVSYSTIYLNVQEVLKLTPTEELTDLERMTKGFKDSFEDVIEGIKDWCINFVINLPYLLVFLVILIIFGLFILLLIKLAKHIDKKNKKNKPKNNVKEEKVFYKRPEDKKEDIGQ